MAVSDEDGTNKRKKEPALPPLEHVSMLFFTVDNPFRIWLHKVIHTDTFDGIMFFFIICRYTQRLLLWLLISSSNFATRAKGMICCGSYWMSKLCGNGLGASEGGDVLLAVEGDVLPRHPLHSHIWTGIHHEEHSSLVSDIHQDSYEQGESTTHA